MILIQRLSYDEIGIRCACGVEHHIPMDPGGQFMFCPNCGKSLIRPDIRINSMVDGVCLWEFGQISSWKINTGYGHYDAIFLGRGHSLEKLCFELSVPGEYSPAVSESFIKGIQSADHVDMAHAFASISMIERLCAQSS